MNFFKNLFSRFKKEDIFLTLLVFALSFIPFLWLRHNQILLGYDNVYPLNPIAFLKDRIFSWSSIQGFGLDQSGQQGSLVIHFIDSLPQFFGASIQLSQKIVFSLWFFLLILSGFILVLSLEKYDFVKSQYLRYIFPVLYSVNFYVLQAWWVAERTKFSLMVATPLILALLLPFAKESVSKWGAVRRALICALILTVFNGGGWGGLSLYGGFLVVVLGFYLFYLISFLHKKRFHSARVLSLCIVLFGLFYVLFNAYTFLPFIFSTLRNYGALVASVGGTAGLIGWTQYISEDASFINLLRLQGIPDWYNSIAYHPYAVLYLKNNFLIILSFIFPLLIFLSFFLRDKRTKKFLSFIIFLFLLSLFFTAGAHRPLGFIYEFLMEKVPGFIIFRSAIFKFGYAFWLSAGLLIGISLSAVVEYLTVKFKKFSALRFILPLLIISFLVFYHFPYLTGDIFRIDKTDVSSRVELPSYINDFSSWWEKNGADNKILLLPKLNDNWLFEQYRWHYLSLFPVLGNFANNGIVENTDQLTSSEMISVNYLYSAIGERDYEKMDRYSSVLGISYFLVRRDFYYDIDNQNTENPLLSEKNVSGNPKIELIKTFGEWSVYGYKNKNHLFFVRNGGVSSDGGDSGLSVLAEDLLLLPADVYRTHPFFFKENLIYPLCISCKAEKTDISVDIPKPKILIDSNLYDLVELKNKFSGQEKETYEHHLFSLVGEMLKDAGQINELIYKDKGAVYVNLMRAKYIALINELSLNLKDINSKAVNPYSTAIIIEDYLDAQNNYLSDLLQRVSIKDNQINVEKVLYEINKVNDKLKEFYGEKNFNKDKYYTYTVLNPKEYTVKILTSSLGVFAENDLSKISIELSDKKIIKPTRVEGKYIVFDNVFLDEGEHTLKVNLPDQVNLFSYAKTERISGANCYSTYLENFSEDASYSLTFSSKNNFDPSFFYFVDEGKDFSPVSLGYFSITGEQIKKNRVIISPSGVQFTNISNKLRASFCAPSLTESLFKENIKDFKIVYLTEPVIVFESQIAPVKNLSLPTVKFEKIDQGHYKVYVENSISPFILVFAQRYSDGWRATTGKHIRSNNFENAWIIDKKGNFSIDVKYDPQKYFNLGIIISSLAVIMSVFVIWKLRKKPMI